MNVVMFEPAAGAAGESRTQSTVYVMLQFAIIELAMPA
jgi:hypothetical protein